MRILIATSGLPYSDVQLGAEIARCTDRSPTVLTVIGDEGERPQANAILAHACELLRPQVQGGQTRIRVGHPAEEIVQEAEEGNYDLVIVADKRHHGWVTRFFLGSTAQRVVEYAPCPVIVAKGRIGPIRRILLCDSGADSSVLINHAARLADLIGGEIEATVLHVMSQMSAGPGVVGKQLRASTEELIQQDSPEGELLSRDICMLDDLNIHPHPKLRHGLVVDEVLAEARGQDYDLLIIGAHRGEGWHRILLDDLARQIIEKAGRPVFVAK